MVKKSAYNGPRNSRIKRQRAEERKKMMIRAGAAALCLAAVIGAVSGIRTLVGGHKTRNQEHITGMEETLPQKLKEINGISVKGLGYEETVAALIKGYDWNLSVSYEGKTEKLNNLIEARTRQYLDEICTQNMEGSYTFDLLDVSELAKEEVPASLPESGIRNRRTGTLDHYDAASGKFVFCGGKDGVVIDQEKLATDISQAVKDQKLDQNLSAEGNFQAADSDEAVQAKYKTLETFTTNTTSNPKRNTNVRLAAEALNGTIVQPGEEFSFNQVIGPRTEEKGYQAAAAYNSGEVVQEVGGGVCQISSTLYRVVFETGMEVTYRRSHTFEPNYVTPGQDATISWGYAGFPVREYF
ncbi:MAG: VanW family protein [Lachnospiraceae bacterium]